MDGSIGEGVTLAVRDVPLGTEAHGRMALGTMPVMRVARWDDSMGDDPVVGALVERTEGAVAVVSPAGDGDATSGGRLTVRIIHPAGRFTIPVGASGVDVDAGVTALLFDPSEDAEDIGVDVAETIGFLDGMLRDAIGRAPARRSIH